MRVRALPHRRRIRRRRHARPLRGLRVRRRISGIRVMRLIQSRRRHRHTHARRIGGGIARREAMLIPGCTAHPLHSCIYSTSTSSTHILSRVVRPRLARKRRRAQDAGTRRARCVRTRRAGIHLRIITRIQGISPRRRRRRSTSSIHKELVVLALSSTICAVRESSVDILLAVGVVAVVVAGHVAEPVVTAAAAIVLVLRVLPSLSAAPAVGVLLPAVVVPV